MAHLAIEQIFHRTKVSKSDSDFTYFFSLLLASEAITKIIVLGMVAAISDDKDRNRYRLEHQLVRADGLGAWGRVLEDAITGSASQFLVVEARREQSELTKLCKVGDWQYDATARLKAVLDHLDIDSEDVPVKSDLKRWFRLFTTLRNKTRAHGATLPERSAIAAQYLEESILLIYTNFSLFQRPWAHLHRNLSGKYRVSPITEDVSSFAHLTRSQEHHLLDGVYIHVGGARRLNLIHTDADLRDFFIANGGMNSKRFELLSYATDDKIDGDGSAYLTPPGVLPPSDTEGKGELVPKGTCLSNAPDLPRDYIERPELQGDLLRLLKDDKRPIITLLGRGGIGKTSLALKVIQSLYQDSRYEGIVWLSSRDVDLQLTGPKPVRPLVLSPDDMGEYYASLVLSKEQINDKTFNGREYLEQQLRKSDLDPCLFVFDNFETTQNPIEMFNWIDSFIRLPNKALITTRLREFKGDYPLEVSGMMETESRLLIDQTAKLLGVDGLLTDKYIRDLIEKSEGHPYVIKVLLGEVAKSKKTGNIPQLVAGTEDILTALFERTYAALSPCSQRAFLTLSVWNSHVPRLALEAVLFRSTQERSEVEKGIDSLLQYSMAESYSAPSDKQEFISLPLVASVFGKKKLNISPSKASIHADVEVLQMMGL
ncbi:NB-ARC domain-containing protein, partial [Rheinheimera soli]|uniref:NB-ARC domain-containing protein n=1 Tax=Rheinheimera soli TaxID=443616 RepID=UPI001E5996FA